MNNQIRFFLANLWSVTCTGLCCFCSNSNWVRASLTFTDNNIGHECWSNIHHSQTSTCTILLTQMNLLDMHITNRDSVTSYVTYCQAFLPILTIVPQTDTSGFFSHTAFVLSRSPIPGVWWLKLPKISTLTSSKQVKNREKQGVLISLTTSW